MDAKEVVDAAIALMNATTLTPELYRDIRSRSKEINIKGEAYSSVWPQTFQHLIALAKFDDAVTVCMYVDVLYWKGHKPEQHNTLDGSTDRTNALVGSTDRTNALVAPNIA